MPLFPSDDWMDAYCTELATHEGAGRAAKALDGVYRFVVEPDGPLREQHSYDVEMRPAGDAAAVARSDGTEQPRLTITARYGRWRQLIEGNLDIAMAVMLRRLRISGDLGVLRRQLDDTKPLTEALHRVDTTWLDG